MRILVVEDDAPTRRLLEVSLRTPRRSVTGYGDAESALAALDADPSPVSMLVLDLGLPGLSGTGACRAFRLHPACSDAHILVVTGDERIETLTASLAAGADDYLLKPVDRRMLGVRLAIAERRLAETSSRRSVDRALARSRQQFETFMDHLPAVAFMRDATGRYIYVNQYYLDRFGVGREDRIGRAPAEVLDAGLAAALAATDAEVRRSGQPRQSIELIPVRGEPHHWLTWKFLLPDEAGLPSILAGIGLDVTDRVRAEESLRASEDRYAQVIRATEDGIWDWDLATGRVTWSDRVHEIFGVRRDEFGGTFDAVLGLTHPDDVEAIRAALDAHFAAGVPYDIEKRFIRPDGSVGYGRTRGQATWDAAGRPVRMVGAVSDVTARKAAEAETVRQKERAETLAHLAADLALPSQLEAMLSVVCERARTALDCAGAAVFLVDDERKALAPVVQAGLADQAPARLRPVPLADVEQRGAAALTEGTTRASAAALLRLEDRLIGSLVVFRDTVGDAPPEVDWQLLQGMADQTALAVANVRLLDELRRIAEQLRQSEERYRLALKDSPIVTMTQDRELRFTWAHNTRIVDAAAMIGRRDEDYFTPEDAVALTALKQRVLDTGTGDRREIALTFLNGRREVYDLSVEPVRDAAGRVTGVTSVGVNITERRKAEAEREQLEEQMRNTQKLESLGVLAGGIAHDFNNLLVGIMGNAGLALMELPEDSPVRQVLHDIELSAQRAADLTRQMLAYAGRGRFVVEPVSVSQAVGEMSQLLGRVISKQARFSLHLPPGLPLVMADATQVRQVVMNLITNASDALNEAPGVISVSTGVETVDRARLATAYLGELLEPGPYVYVEVADTGQGMDEATRARIFDPFFTTKFTGRGLGLAAVLGIVRSHHGGVEVQSRPGGGSTFRVLLPPMVQARVDEVPVPAPAPAWRSSGRVLVVDDEAGVRALADRVLRVAGFEVVLAESGDAALPLVAGDPGSYRAVVLDLTMPGLGGEETLQQLREIRRDLPIVLSSGFAQQDPEPRPHTAFLAKPYRPGDLLQALQAVLGD